MSSRSSCSSSTLFQRPYQLREPVRNRASLATLNFLRIAFSAVLILGSTPKGHAHIYPMRSLQRRPGEANRLPLPWLEKMSPIVPYALPSAVPANLRALAATAKSSHALRRRACGAACIGLRENLGLYCGSRAIEASVAGETLFTDNPIPTAITDCTVEAVFLVFSQACADRFPRREQG